MENEPQVSCENCKKSYIREDNFIKLWCRYYLWAITDPIITAELCDHYKAKEVSNA